MYRLYSRDGVSHKNIGEIVCRGGEASLLYVLHQFLFSTRLRPRTFWYGSRVPDPEIELLLSYYNFQDCLLTVLR